MHLSVTTAQNGVGSSVPPSSCVIPGNVASWLVARFAIVTKILQIILNPCVVWKVRYCGKKSWETTFCPTKMCEWKNYINIFFWKNIACLPPKRIWPLIKPLFKDIRSLIKPLLKNSFSTHFQGTGPWEGPVHFSRFVLRVSQLQQTFPELILEPREERKAFYKSNWEVQSPSLSQKNQTAYP